MIRLNHIGAVLEKQIKDILKNMQVLILFFVFPAISFIMVTSLGEENKSFFIMIFATMHFIFTPLVSTASLISEEKEKNTLRVLIMSGIKPLEYFFSMGLFILLVNLITGSVFFLLGKFDQSGAVLFFGGAVIGALISILLGMCVGTYANNMSAANGLGVPLGMLFSFVPMIASFNSSIEKISQFLYGQQVSYLINGESITLKKAIILGINFLVSIFVYIFLYNRNKSDDK